MKQPTHDEIVTAWRVLKWLAVQSMKDQQGWGMIGFDDASHARIYFNRSVCAYIGNDEWEALMALEESE